VPNKMFGVPIADPPVRGNPTLPMRARPVAPSRPKRYRLKRARSTQTCLDPSRCPRHPSPTRRAFRCVCGKPFGKERGKKERWTLFASDSLAHIRTSLACAFFNFLNLTYVYTCVCVCGRTHFFDRNRVLRITSMALGPTLRSTAG
jgi:hypothetical protein